MNNKDIDLEEINRMRFKFKPLTEGLGFSEEYETKQTQTQTQIDSQIELKINKKKYENLSYPKTNIEEHFSKPQLVLNNSQIKVNKYPEEDNLFKIRFISLLIDIFIVLSFNLIIFIGLLMVNLGINSFVGFINFFKMNTYLSFYFFVVFSIVYILYEGTFSLVNFQTLGKELFGLKVVRTDSTPLNFNDSLKRSFLLYSSLVLLGIPFFWDFHSKLSKTKVIKNL
jgi:uncharacterized RDD family membrane protein YckC